MKISLKRRKLCNRSNRKLSALEAPEFDTPLFPRRNGEKWKIKIFQNSSNILPSEREGKREKIYKSHVLFWKSARRSTILRGKSSSRSGLGDRDRSDNNEARNGKARLQPRSCPRPRSLFLTSQRGRGRESMRATHPTPHFPRFYTSAASRISSPFSLFPRERNFLFSRKI